MSYPMLLVPAFAFDGDGIHMPSKPNSRRRGASFARYVYQSCGYVPFQASHQKAWSTTLPFHGFARSGCGAKTPKLRTTRMITTRVRLRFGCFIRTLPIGPPAKKRRSPRTWGGEISPPQAIEASQGLQAAKHLLPGRSLANPA